MSQTINRPLRSTVEEDDPYQQLIMSECAKLPEEVLQYRVWRTRQTRKKSSPRKKEVPAYRTSADPQSLPARTARDEAVSTFDFGNLTADTFLNELAESGSKASPNIVCLVDVLRFDPSQREVLLPLLWQYILDHRDSNDRRILLAVGAAIRKYVAIMPMDRMGELSVLLESGHRSALPLELEIEVAKMIYRNFKVLPPASTDPQPHLAQRLFEMAEAYTNPRILVRDKHAAAASLAIEAIVAMRSPLAEQACQFATECPYRWFAEFVSDDLAELQARWESANEEAATWLKALRNNLFTGF